MKREVVPEHGTESNVVIYDQDGFHVLPAPKNSYGVLGDRLKHIAAFSMP
jgi:hypothetical protein